MKQEAFTVRLPAGSRDRIAALNLPGGAADYIRWLVLQDLERREQERMPQAAAWPSDQDRLEAEERELYGLLTGGGPDGVI